MSACDVVRVQPAAHQGHRAGQQGRRRTSRTASTTRPSSDLKLAIQTDPTYDIAHYNLGKVYQKQRKWDKAIEAFEAAAQRAPDQRQLPVRPRARPTSRPSRSTRPRRALKKATELDDKLFKAHWRLGLVYILLERPKEADAALRKAIEANPRMDKPFVALGHLYLDYDAAKEAAQVFSECVRANENSAECYNGHGLALKDLKQFEQATTAVQEGPGARARADHRASTTRA